jgi:hypothetical protein
MSTLHPDPRPSSRPRARTLPPGWLAAALVLAPLLVAGCTDDLAAKCPPLAHPEVLTVAAAAGNPCAARKGESAALLALWVVRTYQRTTALAGNLPARFPLRCGDAGYGYLHLLDALSKGRTDHGDPVNDATFDAEMAFTIDHGVPFDQGNNNWRLTVRYNDVQSGCHGGDWGFRVVVGANQPPHPPLAWKPDGLPVGVITAFRLPKGPPAVSYP